MPIAQMYTTWGISVHSLAQTHTHTDRQQIRFTEHMLFAFGYSVMLGTPITEGVCEVTNGNKHTFAPIFETN